MKITTNQDRLCELFDADPRNDTAIALELNVSKQALSAWRNGTRSPKKPVLIKIAQMYNVSLEWLMGFDVPKSSVYTQPPDLSAVHNDPQIHAVSTMMENMSKDQKDQILAIVRAYASTQRKD